MEKILKLLKKMNTHQTVKKKKKMKEEKRKKSELIYDRTKDSNNYPFEAVLFQDSLKYYMYHIEKSITRKF